MTCTHFVFNKKNELSRMISGVSMRSKCALVGTVMDSPAVLGSMINSNVVVVGKVA